MASKTLTFIRNPNGDKVWDDASGTYVIGAPRYAFTINPIPSDATVVLSASGFSQSGNSITVEEGTEVTYTVSKAGYDTNSGTVTLTSNTVITVTLKETTIDPIDESTTVKELAVNSTVYDIVGKGILDQNSKTTRLEWFGTKAEYDALGVYADHCTYIITDDSADSRVDEVGAIAEEVNTLKSYDYVVDWQIPTSVNDYMWYRKYKSGWVEQGGIKLQNTTSKQDLSFPIEMNGSTYSVLTSVMDDNLSNFVFCVKVTDKTTTGFKTTVWGSYQQGISTSGYNFVWQVSGMSA